MDPTVIQVVSSFLILFFFGFNGDTFLQVDTLTALTVMERAKKAISGGSMISGLNTALSSAIGKAPTLPPRNISQCPAEHSWNESCTEMPASVYVPSVFEKPLTASVCFPDGMVDTLGNSTETWDFPVSDPAGFELFGFHLPGYVTHDLIISLICVLLPLCFLLWINITRKPSTVDDGTIPKKSYVDAAITELSGRIPDLGPLLANQRRLEGQLIQIDGVEARVNGRTDNRLRELEVLFQKQIRDINLDPLTSRADKFQENHEFMSSQIKTLQNDQPRWTALAEQVKDLEANLTTQIDRKTNRVQTSIKEHVQDINVRFQDIENKNEKIATEVRQEQTSYKANIDQLKALEKRVTDYVTKNLQLQQQVDDIDAFNQQFKGSKDGTFSMAERMRKLQQQVNNISISDGRVRGLENEMAAINDSIRKLQEQEVPDIKRVRDVESDVTSLKERVRKLQEQSQADNATKLIPNILERLDGCLTIARSQDIQISLNQKISEVKNELQQIPVVNTEEERAHTQSLLENKIETLNIDELRNRLQTLESEVKEDTQGIQNINNRISQTESNIQSEFNRTTNNTEQLIKDVVDKFKSSLEEIRQTINTLQRNAKERALDRETVEKVINDFKTDLESAQEKVRSLELNLSTVAEGTHGSIMVHINDIKTHLQELDKSKCLCQKQEVLDFEQGRMEIESHASSQPSQPPQAIADPKTPSPVNVLASEFVPSSQTPASFSQSTTHSGSDMQAGPSEAKGKNPSTEVISTQSTQAEVAQPIWRQSQEDNQKGKLRETPLPSESSGTSWADQVNDDGQENPKKNQSTNEKSRKSPAQKTTKVRDSIVVEVRPSPMESLERREEVARESAALVQVLSEAAKNGKGDLSKSRWAD